MHKKEEVAEACQRIAYKAWRPPGKAWPNGAQGHYCIPVIPTQTSAGLDLSQYNVFSLAGKQVKVQLRADEDDYDEEIEEFIPPSDSKSRHRHHASKDTAESDTAPPNSARGTSTRGAAGLSKDESAQDVAMKAALRASSPYTDGSEEIDEFDRSMTAEDLSKLVLEKTGRSSVGRWATTLTCPTDLFRHLIGKNGVSRARFEEKYEVQLQFKDGVKTVEEASFGDSADADPQQLRMKIKLANVHDGTVILRHETSRVRLWQARLAMQDLMKSNLRALPYTHFVSLPFLRRDNESLCRKLDIFRQQVLRRSSMAQDKIEESLFQPPGQSHFTLCMLRLYFPEQMEAAKEVLSALPEHPRLQPFFEGQHDESDIEETLELPPSGFHVDLGGVHVMGDDVAHTDVLYTQERTQKSPPTVDVQEKRKRSLDADWLHVRRSAGTYFAALVEILYQEMCDKGLLDWEELNKQRLLDSAGRPCPNFHLTIMNSKLRDPSSALLKGLLRGDSTNVPRLPFNADRILRDFVDFHFGVGKITGLHLSRRGAAAPDTAFYHAELVVPVCKDRGL